MTSQTVGQYHWPMPELKPRPGKFHMWRPQPKPEKMLTKSFLTSWERFEREKWTPRAIIQGKKKKVQGKRSNVQFYKKPFFFLLIFTVLSITSNSLLQIVAKKVEHKNLSMHKQQKFDFMKSVQFSKLLFFKFEISEQNETNTLKI